MDRSSETDRGGPPSRRPLHGRRCGQRLPSGSSGREVATAVQGAKYVFDAWILPELGTLQVEKLTTDRLNRWRNKVSTQPKRIRRKLTATEPASRETPDDDDARRARKATTNRILTMLKAALNRAFQADRVSSDTAWRKVKPVKKVDEAVVCCLSITEARQLVRACPEDFGKLVQGALLTAAAIPNSLD